VTLIEQTGGITRIIQIIPRKGVITRNRVKRPPDRSSIEGARSPRSTKFQSIPITSAIISTSVTPILLRHNHRNPLHHPQAAWPVSTIPHRPWHLLREARQRPRNNSVTAMTGNATERRGTGTGRPRLRGLGLWIQQRYGEPARIPRRGLMDPPSPATPAGSRSHHGDNSAVVRFWRQ
jgi:hypothetical protein